MRQKGSLKLSEEKERGMIEREKRRRSPTK
jgi:hypothetical protein